MSAIRGVKDRRFKFTQLLHIMLEDENLSLKAKGFIGYCLTKPESWIFHVPHLASKLKEGEKAIYSVLKECEFEGYAIRYQTRKENGDFSNWETIVSDSKEEIEALKKELSSDPNFQKSFTLRLFGDAINGDAQNRQTSNMDSLSDIEREQQQPKDTASPVAVVSSKTSKKKQQQPLGKPEESKIYPCLKQIDDKDLPSRDKIQLTKKYTEEEVENAIKWALHPQTKIKTSVVQTIWWACNFKPELPLDKDQERIINRGYANKFDIMQFNDYQIDALYSHVEFSNFKSPMAKTVILSYEENGFIDKFDAILRNIQVGRSPNAK